MENFITNEVINKKFKNQFELVNYAISIAENMLKSGREARSTILSQNKALQVIDEIITGKDQIDEIFVETSEGEVNHYNEEIASADIQKKIINHDKAKRGRKLLVE